jgi:hypothetical protein
MQALCKHDGCSQEDGYLLNVEFLWANSNLGIMIILIPIVKLTTYMRELQDS